MRRRSTASSSPAERGRPGRGRPLARRVRGPAPSTPEEVAAVLELVGVEPQRGLGQSFLIDPHVAEREAALLDVAPGSEVVEVGGGLGQLTNALLARGFQVAVIEKEPRFVSYLATNFRDRVRVIEGDARTVPLPHASAFVGNLPFSTGQEILTRLVSEQMEHGVFLLQREVAERLCARPATRDYGRPTVLFRVDGAFHLAGTVPSSAFHPRPAVEGALVVWRWDPLDPPPRDRSTLELLLEAAFLQRRKMLGKTLPAALLRRFPVRIESVPELAREAGWRSGWERRRAEEITPEEYVALANLLPPARSVGRPGSASLS